MMNSQRQQTENLRKDQLGQQGCLASGLSLGGRPDGKHEANLVHEIGYVVDDVQDALRSWQVAEDTEEVSERVDGPADGHNEAHGLEVGLHGLAAVTYGAASLTSEDLVEDERPAGHAAGEADGRLDGSGLTCVAKAKHGNGSDQEPPEHDGRDWLAGCLEDEVELDHLQSPC